MLFSRWMSKLEHIIDWDYSRLGWDKNKTEMSENAGKLVYTVLCGRDAENIVSW